MQAKGQSACVITPALSPQILSQDPDLGFYEAGCRWIDLQNQPTVIWPQVKGLGAAMLSLCPLNGAIMGLRQVTDMQVQNLRR